jgi:AhpD family alkylhydroperoxidase
MSPRLPSLPPNLPGMIALGAYRPDVAAQTAALADNMLRTGHPESTLIPSEREMIATYISSLNSCEYCTTIHGAVAAAHLCKPNTNSAAHKQHQITPAKAEELVDSISKRDGDVSDSESSPKLKALLQIAAQVRESGHNITAEAIAKAKEYGATDMDIHDTVLIASLFCMFNRYVDGLTGQMGGNTEHLKAGGPVIAEGGYVARMSAASRQI